jgi:transcriptional regulator with XRE-family HTH domain
VRARAERQFAVVLGRRVRLLRQMRSLSTRQLAERAGLSPSMVNAVETGERAPSVIVLMRLTAALRVPWVALADAAYEETARAMREVYEAAELRQHRAGRPRVGGRSG